MQDINKMEYKVMESACVTTKGRLVIPARLRKRYGIKPGTRICFIERDGEIFLQPVTRAYIRSVCGMLKSKTLVGKALLNERAKDEKRERAAV